MTRGPQIFIANKRRVMLTALLNGVQVEVGSRLGKVRLDIIGLRDLCNAQCWFQGWLGASCHFEVLD